VLSSLRISSLFCIGLAVATAAWSAPEVVIGPNYIGWAGQGQASLKSRVMLIRLAPEATASGTRVAVLVDDHNPSSPTCPVLATHVNIAALPANGVRLLFQPASPKPYAPRFALTALPGKGDPNIQIRLYTSGGLNPNPNDQILMPMYSAVLSLADIQKLKPATVADPSLLRPQTR
jgi:hypothetical protein